MSRSGKAVAEVASAPDVDIESRLHFFFFNIYFWLQWVLLAAHGFSLVVVSRATLDCDAWVLTALASLIVKLGL